MNGVRDLGIVIKYLFRERKLSQEIFRLELSQTDAVQGASEACDQGVVILLRGSKREMQR
jgi:hypothetical protein